MFTENDKQILLDHAGTIESGLMRIATAISDNSVDLSEIAHSIKYSGDQIKDGLLSIASALDRHLPE